MLINKQTLTIVLCATLMPCLAGGVAVKNDKCNINVTEPSNSNGYYMSDDCKSVLVLPPKMGKLSITDYRATGILPERCSAINSLEKENANFHAATEHYSDEILANMERAKEYRKNLDIGLIPVGMNKDDVRKEIKQLRADSKEMRAEVLDFKKYYVESMQYHAGREAGVGSFLVENTHNELIEQFKSVNKGDLTFRRLIPDINFLSIVDKSNDPEVQKMEMSALLDLTVAGQPLPMTKNIFNLLSAEPVEVPEEDGKKDIFGAALKGRIRMSDIGACIAEEAVTGAKEFSMNDLRAYIQPNAFYQYQVQVQRRYLISYRLGELFKKMHEQTKKGGFFSRRTVNKMIDARRTDSWITFREWSGDVRLEYTDEDIREIKKIFLDHALRQMVSAKLGGENAALALLDPSRKNGVQAIGGELSKCPHLYCQISAAGFKVLDAIFSSESATSELVKKFEGSASADSESNRMVKQYSSMSFN